MRKSSVRNANYREMSYHYAELMGSFRKMADFANGPRLVALRERRRLSQDAAAHEIGVSEKSLRAWEKGGRVRDYNLERLATFYEVDAESLILRGPTDLTLNGEIPEALAKRLDSIESTQLELLRRLTEMQEAAKQHPPRRKSR